MFKIATITFNQFPVNIKLSESRRTLFWRNSEETKVPKKYKPVTKHKDGFLRDKDGYKIIKNPKTAGKPRYISLNGNMFSSGFASPHIRNKIVTELKKYYKDEIKKQKIKPIKAFPIRYECNLYTDPGPANFDLSNLWFYIKYFEDSLVDLKIIPDDSIKYITSVGGWKLIPIDDIEDRKMEINIFPDRRQELLTNQVWDDTKIQDVQGESGSSNKRSPSTGRSKTRLRKTKDTAS